MKIFKFLDIMNTAFARLLGVVLLFCSEILVAQLPEITQPPSGQTVVEGENVQFVVTASGTNLEYQWMKNGSLLSTGGRIEGATTNTLTINSTKKSDEGSYSVVIRVSGSLDLKVSTVGVDLKVNTATPSSPQISQHPVGLTVIEGATINLTVLASGSNLEYQWLKDGVPLANGGRFSGANSSTLVVVSLLPTDEGSYTVSVTVAGYPALKVSSNSAFIKVNSAPPSAPIITKQPSSQNIIAGSNVNFKVSAVGTGLMYQWFRDGVELTDLGRVSGTNTATLSILATKILDGGSYSVTVTRSDLPELWTSSKGAMLVVVPPAPEIDIQQPKGSKLVDGKTKKSFGTVRVGKSGNAKTFTIKNAGTAKLTGFGIMKAGSDPIDFHVTKPLKTSLPPGESTTFKISFKPTKKGDRSAWIRIKSNDSNESPFDIKLTGLGVKP